MPGSRHDHVIDVGSSCFRLDINTRLHVGYFSGDSIPPASVVPEVSTVLQYPMALNVAPVEVDINATGLGSTVPTTCSAECPSHEAPVPLSVIISYATPNSPTTTWGVLPELATPAVSDKVLDVDVVGDTSRADTICLPADLDDSTGEEEEARVDVSLTLGSVLASFVPSQVLEAMVPRWYLIKCSTEDTQMLTPQFRSPLGSYFTSTWGDDSHSDPALLPWPSFKCSQFWTSLIRQVTSEPREQFSSIALHFRDKSFQHLQVPLVHHEMLKHDKIASGRKWLRPPWPPPEQQILGCHTKEAARSAAHRLETVGQIMLHSVGKFVSSPSSITDNETRSPYVKLCLGDVSWKLPRWWADTQCVRPTNATIDVSSCSWITSKHTKVQFQFSYIVFTATRHFARVHFLFPRRADRNLEINRGTSPDSSIHGGYPALHIAHTRSWMRILVVHLMQYGLDADALSLVIYWLTVPCLQLLLGLIHAVQGYISSSSSVFLTSLNERTEIQQYYAGMRVLPVATHKGQNSHHSPQGLLDLFLKGLSSISGHYLEVHTLDALLIRLSTPASLHAQELYLLLRLYSSCYQFVTKGTTCVCSELVDWQILWYFNPCLAMSSSNWLRVQPIDDDWKFNLALLFSWNVPSTIDSVPANQYIPAAMLLLSSGLSTTLVFYRPVACVTQCKSKMMPWDIASSNNDILTYTEQVLISWYPGGSDTVVPTACNITQLQLLHLIWDPGGSTRHRLEGKPKFKEGGLSATCPLLHSWAGRCDATLGPSLPEDTSSDYKYNGDGHNRLGLERNGKAASAEGLRWLGDRLLFLFFLKSCDPQSSF